MKILHISSARTWRGGERQVQYLFEGLQSKGHYNFLMSPLNSALSKRIDLESNQILQFHQGVLGLIQNLSFLKKYCQQHDIDIIHGHDSHAHTLLWMAYRFGSLHTKSVVTRRLINPIKKRSLKKYNFTKIERIICISKAVKKVMAASIQDPSRLAVIHSSINLSAQSKERKNISSRKNFVIGYVAAFTKEKDHETFIATAKYLNEKYPDLAFKYLLVGDGPLLQTIKEKSNDIKENIAFTGFIKDIENAYAQIDLLLHTSKSEALGTSILEAMKFGIPVVATNIGGIAEIVTHGENGYLCQVGNYKEMAEYVYEIANDKNLHVHFIKNAHLKLQNFDTSTMIEKTFDLYQKVLNS